MPLYEFSCGSCHETSEHLMKISDKSPEICPFCQKEGSLKKLMSRSNFVLKGTGWYETDFKDQKKTKKEKVTTSSSSEKPKVAVSKVATNKKVETQSTPSSTSSAPASKNA